MDVLVTIKKLTRTLTNEWPVELAGDTRFTVKVPPWRAQYTETAKQLVTQHHGATRGHTDP
jgi:hypothetical protein